MKKLDRKGFTLVELLAVIVILAIVVGITLVTVLPTMKKTRQNSFEVTPQTAADYLEKQYQLYLIGEDTTVPFETGKSFSDLTNGTGVTITADQYKAAGLKPGNYDSGTWYINSSTGRACVVLTAKTGNGTDGEYYDVDPKVASSTGC